MECTICSCRNLQFWQGLVPLTDSRLKGLVNSVPFDASNFTSQRVEPSARQKIANSLITANMFCISLTWWSHIFHFHVDRLLTWNQINDDDWYIKRWSNLVSTGSYQLRPVVSLFFCMDQMFFVSRLKRVLCWPTSQWINKNQLKSSQIIIFIFKKVYWPQLKTTIFTGWSTSIDCHGDPSTPQNGKFC
jgi:hypothetical protein